MSKDLGFVLIALDNNQISNSLCSAIRGFIDNDSKSQICIFNSYCERINTHQIPLLHIREARYFDGSLFVFDLPSLLLCSKFPSPKNIYYYAHNFPWTISAQPYSFWKNIFKSDRMKIIAQNQHIHDMYNLLWNNSIGISERFEYDKINQII
jgi:hypothetical protein